VDFRFGDDQTTVRNLARGILEKEVGPERLKRLASDRVSLDRALWSTLAEAGLLGLAVPAELGGMGFGLTELCVLLEEVGRVVAPVPVLPTLVLGALPIAESGTDAQRRDWLAPVAAGDAFLTGAFSGADPAARARRQGGAWLLDGTRRLVPAVDVAARVLVPADTADGAAVFLVDPRASGVSVIRHGTSSGEPVFDVTLAGVRADDRDLLGGDVRGGAAAVTRAEECALVATSAMQVGVCERALELTSGYVRERVQFGVPIGSFQAVQHRLADCYIDVEAMRWVTWRAAWRLAERRPASREVLVAKIWAADAGARVTAAAQHLHGGVGVDVDYPVHRYFLASKALELALGGATQQLARLGRDIARTPPSAWQEQT
jgi:alkylation response protein AidB-like acyl-CoA dehydrogenase